MKWIQSRPTFVTEHAKLKDVLLPKQADKIRDKWGEKWLELEEVEAVEDIDQGVWDISEEDKVAILGIFLGDVDLKKVYEELGKLPKKFVEILTDSVDANMIGDKAVVFSEGFDISKATVDQMVYMFDPVFRKLSVGETKAKEIVLKGDNGRPIMGEDGKIQKVPKKAGDPVYSSNLVNINSFITDYNRAYEKDKVDAKIFSSYDVGRLVNFAKENHNSQYKYDLDIFGRDMKLYIGHDAKEVLNMSISKFYSSCQHLYTGGYNQYLLSNVFDVNSAIAYLKFDSEIHWEGKKISDTIPISRFMIRKVESWIGRGSERGDDLYFDRCYPDRMWSKMKEIVEKYTENKHAKDADSKSFEYTYMPDMDINDVDNIVQPYMDRLELKTAKYIGKNTKKLYLSKSYDWSSIKISPSAKITELIVETTDIPENTFEVKMDLEWVKFRFLKLNSISEFKMDTDSYAFDKCSLGKDVFDDINEEVKKLQFISCEFEESDFSRFEKLDELHLVYTLDSGTILSELLGEDFKVKNLHISGDIMSNTDNKKFVNSLKRKGTKVNVVGPVI